jgi:hypothetical protein
MGLAGPSRKKPLSSLRISAPKTTKFKVEISVFLLYCRSFQQVRIRSRNKSTPRQAVAGDKVNSSSSFAQANTPAVRQLHI